MNIEFGGPRRGSALLVVLIMLGMIAGLAAVVSRSVSSAALELGAAQLNLQSEADLRAGIELGAAAISQLGPQMRSADAAVRLPDRRIAVRITNERGRIDLNLAPPEVLTALFEANGVTDGAAIAHNIVEWRGGSASQKLSMPAGEGGPTSAFSGFTSFDTQPGAELGQAPKQLVGTRFFMHPMQLLSVPGVSKALMKGILPLVTIASGSAQIDPYLSTVRVLSALPNTSPDRIDAFVSSRDGNSGREMAIKILGVPEEMITEEAAPGWRVEVVSTDDGGRVFRGEAVIAILKDDSEPYRVLYVEDGQVRPVRQGQAGGQGR